MACTIGLEKLRQHPELTKNWGKCGYLSNQASVTSQLDAGWAVCHKILGSRLTCLFSPQHGFFGTVQDNMIETPHGRHEATGLPLFSLYSETREPSAEMLAHLDTLIIDLQISGCRIYTWKSTIAACLKAAKAHGKHVVILDRPNPIGGVFIEGRVLDNDCHSFVGQFPMPMRHGLSVAEAARFMNASMGASLEWIAMDDWDPTSFWSHLKRQWVLPSPNLPTADAAYVYPGTVMLEGVNLSEGRGTALPFQFIGAPYLKDSAAYVARVEQLLGKKPDGLFLRAANFQPTYQKWAGKECFGLQIHVLDPTKVASFNLTVALIRAAYEMNPKEFAWKNPPYEYDHVTLPIRLIFGSAKADAKWTAATFDIRDPFWNEGLADYITRAAPHLLYPRRMQIIG